MNAHVSKPLDWSLLASTIDMLVDKKTHDKGLKPLEVSADNVFPHLENAPLIDQTKIDELRSKIGEQNIRGLLRLLKAEIELSFASTSSQQPDSAEFADELHSLAGAAGMLGFTALMRGCRAVEVAIANHQPFEPALEHARSVRAQSLVEIVRLLGENSGVLPVSKTG